VFFRLWCVVEVAAAVQLGKPVVVKGGAHFKYGSDTWEWECVSESGVAFRKSTELEDVFAAIPGPSFGQTLRGQLVNSLNGQWIQVEFPPLSCKFCPLKVDGVTCFAKQAPVEEDLVIYSTKGAVNMLLNLQRMINVEKAECAVRADFDREMRHIRSLEGGVERVQLVVFRTITAAVQSGIDSSFYQMDAAICGEPEAFNRLMPVLQEDSRLAQVALLSAAARVALDLLSELLQSVPVAKRRTSEIVEVLVRAAQSGSEEAVSLILQDAAAAADAKVIAHCDHFCPAKALTTVTQRMTPRPEPLNLIRNYDIAGDCRQ